MAARTRNLILTIFGGVILVGLCAVVGVGSYFVGRQAGLDRQPALAEIEEAPARVEPTQAGEESLELFPPGSDAPVESTPETTIPATAEATATSGSPVVEGETEATPSPTRSERPDFTDEDLDLLWEAWNIVRDEYDGEFPTDEELSYAVIDGLLNSLGDDYTRFSPPDVAARIREDLQGSFEGIGAFVHENEEGLTEIVRPMEGQPAALAGLQAGDVVIAVDGESVVGQGLDEVIARIRGPEGTEVLITVRREGLEEPLDFTVRRDLIEIPIIESEMLDNNVAYVHLAEFNRNADSQLRETLEGLLAQDPVGLVFDLRDNPGGFLDQSVAVADIFLPEGVVLYERSSSFDLNQVHRSDSGDLGEAIPLVVLVNAGSASASEIVAGAIQDRGRGLLIGETTFGKGSVQQVHTLSD
ncbi:MAG TPA: S41 family peptidase, partial [Candidatus Binatia bacterium]|nr:S41 family peptidase [Candidatus Binatia bacterium]